VIRDRPRLGVAGGAGAAAAVVVAAILVSGCGAAAPTLELDGWSTGAFLQDCTAEATTGDCARLVAPALASLDDGRERRVIKIYEEGPYTDASGETRRVDRGASPLVIVVVTYADGARRAAGVFCAETIEGQPPPACTVSEPPFSD
jgi:hypothetical protein